jgi:hypothetical protein
MNTKSSLNAIAYLALSGASLIAGTSGEAVLAKGNTEPSVKKSFLKSDLLSFSLDATVRYEFREQDGFDASHAGTSRFRPGLTLFPSKDLNFFVEGEHTFAFIDDYQVGTPQAAKFNPFRAGNTEIADPESNELNQAFLKYKIDDFATVTVGRQRYILDNAAFVGNVGWRQNEQTLDAVSVKGKLNEFSYSYALGNQVNRIFGSDATDAVRELEGTFHLLNGKYKVDDIVTIGGYTYLMDFDQGGWASNNTYGVFSDLTPEFGKFHVELAYQTDAGNKANYDAIYAAASWTKKYGAFDVSGGVEYLGDQFVAPLSTAHAFNGFADTFVANRLGLVDTWDGIADFYVGAGTKVGDLTLTSKVHAFFDDSVSDQYGWEIDTVAVKPINDSMKVLAKAAYFIGEEGTPFDRDVKQFSVQLDYTF